MIRIVTFIITIVVAVVSYCFNPGKKRHKFVVSELEENIHKLANTERKNMGLSLLTFDVSLSNVARSHSEDMAKRNYFAHETPEGVGLFERYKRRGIKISKMGGSENIWQGNSVKSTIMLIVEIPFFLHNTQEEIARSAVNGWMNSPGHRKNLLTPYWTQEGIGVGISQGSKIYVTQDFI